MKQQSWLDIAEYISLAGSALGTVVAVTSQQVVYAATPLTIALALNVVNRRQFQQQTQENTTTAITEAYQHIQNLHQQVQTLPAINNQLNSLTQQFNARPDKQAIEQSQAAIVELKEQLNSLSRNLEQLPTSSEVDLSSLDGSIADINERVNTLAIRFDRLPASSEVDLSGFEEAIAQLYAQINTLNQQFNERPEIEQLSTLSSRLDQLPASSEINLSVFEEAIAQIYSQLNDLTQQFDNRPELQAIEQSQTAIGQLTEQLSTLSLRLEELPTSPATDTSRLHEAIADINERLESLTLRLDELPTSPATDTSRLHEAIADINERLESLTLRLDQRPASSETNLSGFADINERLESLTLRLDELPTSPATDTSELHRAIADINERLESLMLRLDQLPALPETDLNGLEEAIVQIHGQLNTQLDTLRQHFETRPEQEAIAQLTEQLNALTSRLDQQPTSATVDLSTVEVAIAEIKGQVDTLTVRVNELPTAPDADLSGVEEAITHINSQLDTLNQQFNERPELQVIELLTEQLSSVSLRLDQLPTSSSSTVDLYEVEAAIAALSERLNAISLPIEQSPPAETVPDILESSPTVPAIELSPEEQVIATINHQLDALNQKFSFQSETQTIQLAQTAIAQLKEQLNTIALRLGNLPTAPQIELSPLEASVADINSQLQALEQQLLARPEIQAVEQLGEAIVQLTDQLNSMMSSPDGSPAPLDDDAIKDIDFQLNAMELCLENLPTPPDIQWSGVEDAIAEINRQINALTPSQPEHQPRAFEVNLANEGDEAIADINRQLDALNQRLNPRLDAKTLEQLEVAFAELKNEVNAISFYLDTLPTDSDMDFSEGDPSIADLQW
ncbi:hypothetical protein IQ258_08345 [Coleofasciculus sp. LEGE 07081]|uniref:hypothetical protein n=1 Tax=Coleofasciculus sp. LEGE 07081 TaxID=2777967 RepID=UPI0018817F30|nr:hypothetical protein [Coleofasciculus sp. LEGE 07081]MBE9126164.1 hypothetical protein [Coleofasciculus sp. LEGE 07081]